MPNKTAIDPPPSNIKDMEHFAWKTWFQSIFNRFGEHSGPFPIAGFAKTTLPSVSEWGSLSNFFTSIIFVTNDVGGPTLAFSDGTNWRRVSDNNIIS